MMKNEKRAQRKMLLVRNAIIITIIVALWVISIVLDLKTHFNLINFSFLIMILCLLSILVAIVGCIRYFSSKRLQLFIIGIIMLVFTVSEIYVSNNIHRRDLSETVKQAEKVIEALSRYYNENNRYPDDLNKLVPEYLDNLPKTKIGWSNIPLGYKKQKEKGYRLYYGLAGRWNAMMYDSEKKEWIFMD